MIKEADPQQNSRKMKIKSHRDVKEHISSHNLNVFYNTDNLTKNLEKINEHLSPNKVINK